MSPDSSYFAVNAFSLVILFTILGSSMHSKQTFKDNLLVILSAFLMFVVFFMFFFENRELMIGHRHYFLSFFTYFISSFSLALIVTLIVSLYEDVKIDERIFIYISIYGFLGGSTSLIDCYVGTFTSHHFFLGGINSIPLIFLMYRLIVQKRRLFTNVFFYQIASLLILFIAKTVNVIYNISVISFANPTEVDVVLTMFTNMAIYSFFLSYIFKKLQITTEFLNSHKRVLENSLSEVKVLSETDGLTGVYNRRKTEELINDFFEVYNSNGKHFSVIMVDIDSFKQINDTYGHNQGDEVLKFISNSLKKILRDYDVVGRWGGDEFLIILPNTVYKEAVLVVEKLRRYFIDHEFIFMKQPVRLSYGIATSIQRETMLEIIERADQNMYIDKDE